MKHEVRFFPAYHKVHDDPRQNCGVHGVEIHFIASNPLGAVIFRIFTGWMLPETVQWWKRRGIDGRRDPERDPSDAGVIFHSGAPMYEGHECSEDDCPYIGKPCYQDIGFTLGEEPLRLLRCKGDEAVWAWLDHEHESRFAKNEFPKDPCHE